MNEHSRQISLTSTTDCCILLLTCLAKAFHDGTATFTTGDFECMMCLKKFSLKKSRNRKINLMDFACKLTIPY